MIPVIASRAPSATNVITKGASVRERFLTEIRALLTFRTAQSISMSVASFLVGSTVLAHRSSEAVFLYSTCNSILSAASGIDHAATFLVALAYKL